MKKYKRKSQVFLSVLIVLAMVLTIGAALLFRSRSFRGLSSLQVDSDQAYTLAQSGLAIGESFVDIDPCSAGPSMDQTYDLGDGKSLRIKIDTVSGSGTITSTGTMGSSVQVLEKPFVTPPLEGWAKAYGDPGADRLVAVEVTSDGGYICIGDTVTYGAGGADILLIKTDSWGTIEWAKTYGGTGTEYVNSFKKDGDGGYIFGGRTDSFGEGSADFILIKTDSSGNITWASTYGRAVFDHLYCFQQTSDGGYVLGGSSDFGSAGSDFTLVKINSSGTVSWAKRYGSSQAITALQQTSEGGYLLTGFSDSFNGGDGLVIKTNSLGNVTWIKAYGGPQNESISELLKTDDGGYLFGGSTYGFGAGQQDILLIKADSSGAIEWAKTYGGTANDGIATLQHTGDGGYLMSFWTQSFGPGGLGFIKTDSSGNVELAKNYGDLSYQEACKSIQETGDGYIVAGYKAFTFNDFDYILFKTDSQGDVDCCDLDRDATPTVTDPAVTATVVSVLESSLFDVIGGSPPLTVTTPSVTTQAVCPQQQQQEEPPGGEEPPGPGGGGGGGN